MNLLLIGAIVAALVVLFVLIERSERRRRAQIAKVAERLGLDFSPDVDFELAQAFPFLGEIFGGRDRCVFSVCQGMYGGHPVQYFDYQYSVFTGKQSVPHFVSVVVLEHAETFPRIEIAPRRIEHAAFRALGLDDLVFESEEFNKGWWVASNDRRFAYDFCHPRMMEALLRMSPTQFEIVGNQIAILTQPRMPADEIPAALDRLVRIRELIPPHLYAE